VQGWGELRRELSCCLRTGRAQRRLRSRMSQPGGIPGKVMISERPTAAGDWAVAGHWEGDLIIGGAERSAVGALVDGASRFVLLFHVPDGRDGEKVNQAMRSAVVGLPEALRRTITWDQGKGMAAHAQFSIDTGIQIYFCDPHSPWQPHRREHQTVCCANTCPRAQTSAFTALRTSSDSRLASTLTA
jgi:IS30 family transposase